MRACKIVEGLIAEDDRIRLVRSDVNGGPAAARNRALDIARGEWISILDGDDLMHPARLQSIIDEASKERGGYRGRRFASVRLRAGRHLPQALFSGRWAKSPQWVSAEEYVLTNNLYGRGPALGYLKPVIRSSVIAQHKLRYDERLTIAEDYDFIFRLLMAGAKFRTLPQIGYFYRRHSGSVSHRLSSDALQRIADAEAGWAEAMAAGLAARRASCPRALHRAGDRIRQAGLADQGEADRGCGADGGGRSCGRVAAVYARLAVHQAARPSARYERRAKAAARSASLRVNASSGGPMEARDTCWILPPIWRSRAPTCTSSFPRQPPWAGCRS